MALPAFAEARVFYQIAKQRFEDARFLLDPGVNRTTAAVYLAGYGVECILKALVLSAIANERRRQQMRDSFTGRKAHDFGWLKKQYIDRGGAAFPTDIARNFAMVNTWTTDMRYKPGTTKRKDAEAFFGAAEKIITWADGRL